MRNSIFSERTNQFTGRKSEDTFPQAEMVRPSRAPPPLPCARLEPRRCFLSLCFFPRTQVWPKPPLCVSWVRRWRQDLERVASSTCASQPLPACMRSLHHLRTCFGTVLRNLPSVQWFVSAQVLQYALATAATPSPAHSGTRTHNPKPQQKPAPSSSNPFMSECGFKCETLTTRLSSRELSRVVKVSHLKPHSEKMRF